MIQTVNTPIFSTHCIHERYCSERDDHDDQAGRTGYLYISRVSLCQLCAKGLM